MTNIAIEDLRVFVFNVIVSAAVLGFLAWLLYLRAPTEGGPDLSFMPAVNAGFNATSALLLSLGFVAIRMKKPNVHRALMIAALAVSAMFLVGYIVYHSVHGDTKYPVDAPYRLLYLGVLASHVLLSMVLPFLAFTVVYFAWRKKFQSHRKVARVTLPIWLYVSVTGVVIFFMLRAATS